MILKSIRVFILGLLVAILLFYVTPPSFAAGKANTLSDFSQQTYKYAIELKIPKSKVFLIWPFSKIARVKVSVSIPADWPGQELFISSVSPKPEAMNFGDSWAQNQDLVFFLPTDSDQKITIKGYEVITPVNLDLLVDIKKAYLAATIDEHKYNLYVKPSRLVESDDPEIIKIASEIRGNKTKISEIVAATYDFVVKKIDYNYLSLDLIKNGKPIKLQSAVETLHKGSGICGDYSRLLIALLRAQGIPARMVIGAVDTGEKFGESSPLHAWVQVFVTGAGFIDVDPTWGEDGEKYISDIDMNHIRLQFATPVNEDNPWFTDGFLGYNFLYFDNSIYNFEKDQFDYSIKFTKIDKVRETDNALDIRALAPVFISPDGYLNPTKNTISYLFRSVVQDPVYLFVIQIAVPVLILLLLVITRKVRNKRRKDFNR